MFRSATLLLTLSLLRVGSSFHVSPWSRWRNEIRSSAQQTGVGSLQMSSTIKKPGTAKLDTPWAELGFEFRPTNSHVRMTWRDGKWGEPELVKVRERTPRCGLYLESLILASFFVSFADNTCYRLGIRTLPYDPLF